MENSDTTVEASRELRSRIRSYLLDDGLQCSQCVVVMLRERLGPRVRDLEAAAIPFGRGMAGTGGTCGALSGALLALGAMHETDPAQPRPRRPVSMELIVEQPPLNDWLDVQPEQEAEPPVFTPGRELIARVAELTQGPDGPINCAEISGVDWSAPTREQLSSFYSPDGEMARCIELIGVMVETVDGLLNESRSTTT